MSHPTGYRVLIVDDQQEHLKRLSGHLHEAIEADPHLFGEYKPTIKTESDARKVEALIRSESHFAFDIIIADIFMPIDPDKDAMPDPNGGAIRLYNAIKETGRYKDVFLVIMTNRNSDAEAHLRKIRKDQKGYGAAWAIVHYPKPETTPGPSPSERLLKPDDWKYAIGRAIGCCKDQAWKKTFVRSTLEEIIGCSTILTEAKIRAERFANQRIVLITGETGSGKELIAQAIHRNSTRNLRGNLAACTTKNCEELRGPFAAVGLFGCLKGYATEVSAKAGLFERDLNGTVFLDEFGTDLDIAKTLDRELRRFLRTWEFARLGGGVTQKFTGTVVFGGSKLDSLLKSSDMDPDFISRVGEAPKIDVPPLRGRPDDIISLAEFFLEKSCDQAKKPKKTLSREAKRQLQCYSWPGNVGQLDKMMENLALELKIEIGIEDLPEHVRLFTPPKRPTASLHEPTPEQVIEVLKAKRGNRAQAARLLFQISDNASAKTKDAARNQLNDFIERFSHTNPEFASRIIPPPRPKGGRPAK